MSDAIMTKCEACAGDGVITQWGLLNGAVVITGETPCPVCAATGFVETGYNANQDINARLSSVEGNLSAVSGNVKVALEYLEKILANLPKV